jgi:hypothetical protein
VTGVLKMNVQSFHRANVPKDLGIFDIFDFKNGQNRIFLPFTAEVVFVKKYQFFQLQLNSKNKR